MNLGIFFTIGSGFRDLQQSGQDKRFIDYYLKKYNQNFEKVYVFSYLKEKKQLSGNCYLVVNKHQINRFLYALVLPFVNFRQIKEVDIFRVMQLTGSIPAIISKLLFQKPFIFTYGYDYPAFARTQQQYVKTFFLKILEFITVRFCQAIISTNKQSWCYLRQHYPKVKIYYLPNGVDVNKFNIKRQYNINKNKQNFKKEIEILFVGRLEKQKNLQNLIKAAATLKTTYPLKLLFIGQGSQELQLISLANKLKVNLQIINKVSHSELPKYYQQAHIFALVSLIEGTPKALLEAMACGLPCLVSKYPGAEEFKNNKEILLTGFYASEITANLQKLITSQNLRLVLSKNARNKIVKNYNLNKLLDKECLLIKNILNKNDKKRTS